MADTTHSPIAFSRDVRADFPILEADLDGIRPVYLDNAATTHKPLQVLDAMHHFYCHENSNVGRSVHTLSMRATSRYQKSRERVQRFINAERQRRDRLHQGHHGIGEPRGPGLRPADRLHAATRC